MRCLNQALELVDYTDSGMEVQDNSEANFSIGYLKAALYYCKYDVLL